MKPDTSAPMPPGDSPEAAKVDFSRDMSYGDYLHLDELLGAQQLRSETHDEMLFIVQHQVSELWMKLLVHELEAAIAAVAADEVQKAFKMLARVSKIMDQLVHAWDVLGHHDAARVLRHAAGAGLEQRLPELAIPSHRVHARQQERGHAEAAPAPARSARPRAGCPRRAVTL